MEFKRGEHTWVANMVLLNKAIGNESIEEMET